MVSSSQGLHPTAAAVYRFIVDFKAEHCGDSPSRREMSERLDVPLSVVHHHMVMLERAGPIVRPSARDARRIGIPGAVWTPTEGQGQLERKGGVKVG